MSVTLTNGQSSSIKVTSITITGTDFRDFNKGSTNCGTVVSKGKCTASAFFKPIVGGARAATLEITTTNDPLSPHKVILSGTGLH
jgi:hypothetical protein